MPDLYEKLNTITQSFFVSANAGSGKTRALIGRLITMILRGVKPNKILCITYTTNGAEEIKTRINKAIFKIYEILNRNGFDEQDIVVFLGNEYSINITPHEVNTIKTNISNYLDNNDKLMISTFHAFCGDVISRFCAEAAISPSYKIIDTIDSKILLSNVKKSILASPNFHQYLSEISFLASGTDVLESFLSYIQTNKSKFVQLFWQFSDNNNSIISILQHLYKTHGVEEKYIPQEAKSIKLSIINAFEPKIDKNILHDILNKLQTIKDSGIDLGNAKHILERGMAFLKYQSFENLVATFTNKNNTITIPKINRNITTMIGEENISYLNDCVEILEQYTQILHPILCVKMTHNILLMAYEFLALYDQTKAARSLLDFDDMILKAHKLLTSSEHKEWIKFKMDGLYDHILVDEAQDTNDIQWNIIKAITQDYFPQHKDNKTLTIFGDLKQAIFGFQGADVDIFQKVKQYYGTHNKYLEIIALEKSFRSTTPILELAQKLSGIPHFTNRPLDYGVVHVMPNPKTLDEKQDCDATKQGSNYKLDIARQITDRVVYLLNSQRFLPDLNRKLQASDIMILFRQRNADLIGSIIQNLQEYKIDCTDLSRQIIAESDIICDLICAIKVVLNKKENFSLISLLRSPIFAFDDDTIEQLCLINTFRPNPANINLVGSQPWIHEFARQNSNIPTETQADLEDFFIKGEGKYLNCFDVVQFLHPQAFKVFEEMQHKLDHATVAEFAEWFGTRFKAFYSTIEIDVLQNFLGIIDKFESIDFNSTSNFEMFLDYFEVIKDLPLGSNQQSGNITGNKLMLTTVHKSKGLEASIVILADTSNLHDSNTDVNFLFENLKTHQEANDSLHFAYYSKSKNLTSAFCTQLTEVRDDKATKEDQNLLYVAVTRARDELYICGTSNKAQNSWYDKIKSAVNSLSGGDLHYVNTDKIIYHDSKKLEENQQITDNLNFSKAKNPVQISTSEFINRFGKPEIIQYQAKVSDQITQHNFLQPAFADSFGLLAHATMENIASFKQARDIDTILDSITKTLSIKPSYLTELKRSLQKILELDSTHLIKNPSTLNEISFILKLDQDIRETLHKTVGSKIDPSINLISGRFDKILVTPNHIHIIDIKTQNPMDISNDQMFNIKLQMLVYKLAAQRTFKNIPVTTYIFWFKDASLLTL